MSTSVQTRRTDRNAVTLHCTDMITILTKILMPNTDLLLLLNSQGCSLYFLIQYGGQL